MRAMFLVCLAAFLISGCASTPKVVPHKIENVTRVFFMGSGAYAVLTESPETKELTRHHFNSGIGSKVKLFADCPADKKMFVEVLPQPENDIYTLYVIHVHSVSEVSGGNVGDKVGTPVNVVK